MATENEILQTAQEDARTSRMSEDVAIELLTLSWLKWSHATDQSLPAGCYVGMALKAARYQTRIAEGSTYQRKIDRMAEPAGGLTHWIGSADPSAERIVGGKDALETLIQKATELEKQIIAHVCDGALTTRAIAARLGLCVTTVRKWRRLLYKRYLKLTK